MYMFRFIVILRCLVAIIIILASGQFSSCASVIDIKNYRRFLTVNSIRLVHGQTQGEGSVEILHNGQWGSICFDGWDSREAKVVCRMLGWSTDNAQVYSTTHHHHSHYHNGVNFWIHSCLGTESDLTHCLSVSWYNHGCSYLAGVRCHGAPVTTTATEEAPTTTTSAKQENTKGAPTTTLSTIAIPTKGTPTIETSTLAMPTKATRLSAHSHLSTFFVKPSKTVNDLANTQFTVNTFSVKDCRDIRYDCNLYANYCNLFGNWGAHECPVTCGFCKPSAASTSTQQQPHPTRKHWVTIL